MLSTKQRKLRDLRKDLKKFPTKEDLGVEVRPLVSEYDLDRLTELWANLTTIQQMRGNTHWLDSSANSAPSWSNYIKKLVSSSNNQIIVFDDKEKVFGFAFLALEKVPEEKNAIKAVLKEIYLEPSHRSEAMNHKMAEMLRDCMKSIGIEFVQFDVKDLLN